MPADPNKTYSQVRDLLIEIKEQAKFETRLSLIEQELENYVKETDIHKMISAKLKKFEEDQQKIDRKIQGKTINWTAILQTIIAGAILATITAVVTYYATRGGS